MRTYLMRQSLALIACVLLAACSGGSNPNQPTKVPTLSKTKFLAFGDSLTAGEVTLPVGVIADTPGLGGIAQGSFRMLVVPTASYPTQLLSMLQARFATQSASTVVNNAGVAGEYSFQGATRFPETLAAAAPDVVLLLHGVNDLPLGNTDLPAGSLHNMTEEAKRRGALVFLSTLMPTRPGGRNSPNVALVEELNLKIKAIAALEGATLVNLYDALLPEANSIIGSDGLHPTEAGYKRMADVFLAAIQNNLEVK
jgi:lysophospholipase L1-like esterase